MFLNLHLEFYTVFQCEQKVVKILGEMSTCDIRFEIICSIL